MNTALAMKQQGLRYYSSLTPIQKDRTIYLIVIKKLDLLELHKGIPKNLPVEMQDELLKTRDFVESKLKKQKCFNKDGVYYPLNIREILKN